MRLQDTDPAKSVQERHPWTMQSLRSVTILTISIFAGALASAILGSIVAYYLSPSTNLFYSTVSWWGSDSTAIDFRIASIRDNALLHKEGLGCGIGCTVSHAVLGPLSIVSVVLFRHCPDGYRERMLLCIIAGIWIMICLQDNLPILVIGITLILGFTVTATILDYGPFTGRDKQDEYMVMQAYLIVLTFLRFIFTWFA